MNTSLPATSLFRGWINRTALGSRVTGSRTRVLGTREILTRQLSPGQAVLCVVGTVWITVDGNPADILLQPGEVFVAENPCRLVAEALSPATLRFEA